MLFEPMLVPTERLEIAALTPDQLRLWVEDLPRLERELDFRYGGEPLEGTFRKIVQGQLAVTEREAQVYYWHSFWLIIRREDRVAVGSMDFKSAPDGQGAVEIGYGLGADYEHHGYMTETVEAMCRWALNRPEVKTILAETELDGTASQRILQRCGFREFRREETIWWRREEPASGAQGASAAVPL